ncbi:hypothetical protein SSX86_003002 [Deinandra increscens subsp. villosa]|uniref:Hydroxyproline-rich glycoprotein family protein n=1 Tax=Deinandra increscens subsp. villosa TaxID=3103831 RepID=A0AAP0H8H7_9ASTR
MENHNPKDHPHLSGAYIRTLVKHLTSTKPLNGSGDDKLPESPPSPPPPPHKKQVRRRRPTTKPYQQRLLNMAEARREIVTALKFHRKQREIVVANTVAATTPSDLSSNYPSVSYHWPISSPPPPPPPPPLNQQNLDFTLPSQTLGLNLNFQDFINLDANLYHNPISNYSSSSSSSLSSSQTISSSSSAVVVDTTAEEVTAASQMLPEEVVATSSVSAGATTSSSSSSEVVIGGGLHHAMDDEEMEEIRSLGEQHQMEWNDTMSLVTSARWFKFLKTTEIEQGEGTFDQVIEFPPCMDIDEIEGMDGEWLA